MDQVCQTCHHYRPLPSGARDFRPKSGVCTHPFHATIGIPILIKPLELRCRRGFGQDDWRPSDDEAPVDRVVDETTTDRVIDEKTSDPDRQRKMAPRVMIIPTYLHLREAVAD